MEHHRFLIIKPQLEVDNERGISFNAFGKLWNIIDEKLGNFLPSLHWNLARKFSGEPIWHVDRRYDTCGRHISNVWYLFQNRESGDPGIPYVISQLARESLNPSHDSVFYGRRLPCLPDGRLVILPASA